MQTVNIKITYAGRQDKNYDKSFKPCVWVNGKYHYTTERNKKSFRGALNTAKKVAESVARYYLQQNVSYDKYIVTLEEIK